MWAFISIVRPHGTGESSFPERDLALPGAASHPGPSVRWCHLARGAPRTGPEPAPAPRRRRLHRHLGAPQPPCYQEASHHGCRERKSQLLIFSVFCSYWNLLKFLDKTFKRRNRTETCSSTEMTPRGSGPRTASVRGQGVGVGEGFMENTGWFDSLNMNLRGE